MGYAVLDGPAVVPGLSTPSVGAGTAVMWLHAALAEMRFSVTGFNLSGTVSEVRFGYGLPEAAGTIFYSSASNDSTATATSSSFADLIEGLAPIVIAAIRANEAFVVLAALEVTALLEGGGDAGDGVDGEVEIASDFGEI